MANENFDAFAKSLAAFERRLAGMVAASVVYGAAASMLEYSKFDLGFRVFTGFACTIAGIAGLLPSYLASLRNSRHELDYVLLYEPQKNSSMVRTGFVLAALTLGGAYVLVRADSLWSAALAALSSFLFFLALTKAHVIIRTSDRQELTWAWMTEEQREQWQKRQVDRIKFEYQQELDQMARQRSLQESIEKVRETTRAMAESTAAIKMDLRRAKRDRRLDRWKKALKSLLRASQSVRQFVWKDRLLTRWERCELAIERASSESAMSRLILRLDQAQLQEIKNGKVPPQKVEQLGMEVYPKGVLRYVWLPEPFNKEAATAFLEKAKLLAPGTDGEIKVIGLLKSGSNPTIEAEHLLTQAGIKIIIESSSGTNSNVEPDGLESVPSPDIEG